MAWFNYKTDSATPTVVYPPVRRKVAFSSASENLKVGDWIYVSMQDVNIGRVYSKKQDGSIDVGFDDDSYVVVYETETTNTITYSIIDANANLYFKSVTEVSSGSVPEGNYYIYYHKDNIQYMQLIGSSYSQTVNPSGPNFIAKEANAVNYYSNIVKADSTNSRISAVSFIPGNGSWQGQKSNAVGNKVLGSFSGPLLRINGQKSPSSGIVSIKINKTSLTSTGQMEVKSQEIDLYNSTLLEDELIFSIDIRTLDKLTSYEDLYGSFSFEIEILDKKNINSSDKNFKINQYSFNKNYNLELEDEEVYEGIIFSTTGIII
jgi:hypothetical protein